MNAHTDFSQPNGPDPILDAKLAALGYELNVPDPDAYRCYGWTADRQHAFLEAIAEGESVDRACRRVGLTRQSAYAFRRTARGASFALGWQGAVLIARNALIDTLMDRAMHGTPETIVTRTGERIERVRHDNRLAMAMLRRMDRMVERNAGGAGDAAARMVAADFEQYASLVGSGAGPAIAARFLDARVAAGVRADLAPAPALARADRWIHNGIDLSQPLDTGDLDPACRNAWTAEQWARADAAGLIEVAKPGTEAPCDDSCDGCQNCQPDDEDDGRVWWSDVRSAWCTDFPPPEGTHPIEHRRYGDPDYFRELTPEERAVMDAAEQENADEARETDAAARDRWFGFDEAGESDGAPAAESGTSGEESDETSGTANPSNYT